ncbi:MAG TPA: hypothetical protein VI566_09760 [Xanthomonadales bacterium]|nr:hypothetical protein [Xanthomonadales bacterium]
MSSFKRLGLVLLVALLPLGCVSTQPHSSGASFPLTIYDDNSGIWVPADPASRGTGSPRLPQADRLAYQANGPYPLALSKLPPQAALPDLSRMVELKDKGRIKKPIPEEAAEKLRANALLLPPAAMVQRANAASGPGPQSPVSGGSGFDSLDYTDCCGGGGNVPADSELAVGPNHIIAVVNVAFEIYDKSGTKLQGPTKFASLFAGVPNCSSVFDPNVIYDEKENRFILAIDGNGTDFCIAASVNGDPLGSWNRYSFATDVGGNFFDYPHSGVGEDAIYMGANMFGRRSFAEGRVWAIDKDAMYAGSPAVNVVTRSTGGESTPQPMNLHGFAQGTWPSAGAPHYFLTDGPFDGARYGVWSWTDPFAANTLVNQGTVNLNTFTGVTAGAPVDAPQSGSSIKLDGNDWRVQDAEYRNGYIWMADTIACNPGAGTVDCVRWAQIDPTGTPLVMDAGVYGSDGQYRIFADLAVDDCDNMSIGYTRTSTGMWPSVHVTGRESTDAAGTLQSEVQVKAGEIAYTSFQSGTTHRWGDYTAMTIDPDGQRFWYMGQYSKNTGTTNGRWGNWIAPFSFACDTDPGTAPGQASNPSPANGGSNVSINADLAWTAGANATSHDVYFGTDSTPDASELLGNQVSTSYNLGTLSNSTTYYWRIDEVNSGGTTTGNLWSFTTEAGGAPTLVGSSVNNGKTWTARVQNSNGSALTGTWSTGASCTNQTTCSLGSISKKTASVKFKRTSDNAEITVFKP